MEHDLKEFGNYTLERRLAVGGMGEIFLARQKSEMGIQRKVIIKTMLPGTGNRFSQNEQFLDEARIAANLNHPNIVTLYEVGMHDDTPFIALEYIAGKHLGEILFAIVEDGFVIPEPILAKIIHDACVGLQRAHQAVDIDGRALHIVHRDVSPQNIMVRNDGVTKILDFGIAAADNREHRTGTGIAKGKIGYMAPEQILTNPLDGRCDQFALGVVVWEMVAKRRFREQGGSTLDVLSSAVGDPAPTLSNESRTVDPLFSEIVERMTALEPANRYPDCGAVARAWKAFLQTHDDPGEDEVAACLAPLMQDLDVRSDLANLADETEAYASKEKVGLAVQGATKALSSPQQIKPQATALGSPLHQTERIPVPAVDRGDEKNRHGHVESKLGASRAWRLLTAIVLVIAFVVYGTGLFEHWLPKKEPAVTTTSMGTVLMQSTPPGAKVWSGNKLLGVTPLPEAKVAADKVHRLRFVKKGFVTEFKDLRLQAGSRTEVHIQLKKIPPATPKRREKQRNKKTKKKVLIRQKTPPPAPEPPPVLSKDVPVATGPGFLSVETRPWTRVKVGNLGYRTTPFAKMGVSAGEYTLRFQNAKAGIDETRTATIEAGKTTALSFDFGIKK
jgi:serine/threonine protein kinase